ncbi:MAG TPA: molybdopterin dinucleotide binding domain-containing protein, partial [Steroidobacteraceae bacterium]|nr:molybdopterin dinucleotide binding domain-containing protein [Steroidobacteraceae bacterium]
MANPPTTEALLEHFVRRSRVPLEEIKRHPHGAIFPDPQPLAEPKEPGWPHRLQLAEATMLAQLAEVAARLPSGAGGVSLPLAERGADASGALELLLVSRREHAVYNSVGHHLPALRKRRPYNPAYIHPEDARRAGLDDGAMVTIESTAGAVTAVLHHAPDVRPGVVSMAHGFFASTDERRAASTSTLVDDTTDCEPITGLPRMSAIPVTLKKAVSG